MCKKFLAVLFVSVFLLAFSHRAHAFVEGHWNMDIVEKIKAKAKGVGTYKDIDYFSDNWYFSADRNFYIHGIHVGTWEIIGKKFYVYINEATMNAIFEENLVDNADFPSDTKVTIYVSQASGKQKKDGTIKAKYKFQATIEAYGVTGKLTIKGKATGIKISDNPSGGDLASQLVGVWSGDCDGRVQEIQYSDSMNIVESDEWGGNAAGTYTVTNDTLCMNITSTNAEGCAAPSTGQFCSRITISDAILSFYDFSPGSQDGTYTKQQQ